MQWEEVLRGQQLGSRAHREVGSQGQSPGRHLADLEEDGEEGVRGGHAHPEFEGLQDQALHMHQLCLLQPPTSAVRA